ncbi:hypothetical protein [Kitasatospora cineracea]|uniref:DUF3618 domain-containing protein n=1 Tax=Kitasatospora cineracea TaxID=88074 RepID=A0A3N4R7C8_9ACTN|nr:hypothetical protein [Kitasatospora cineracea]RPE27269.1 hypothetical protein EDD38_7414 [Kitasatospora cineracea]
MTAPPQPDPGVTVALELAELRRSVDVGFARTDGQLNLLLQRADQTDARVADLDKRVDSLERGRWPLPTIAALAGIGGLVLAAVPLLQH